MNCPKCNAELKPGAKFCHVCGLDVSTIPAPQMPVNSTPPPASVSPVYQQHQPQPQQQPQYQYQQQQQQQQQQQFSYQRQQQMNPQSMYAPQAVAKNGSSTSMIAGIAALVGAVGVFLPWVRVSFWGMTSSASGIDVWQGIIALILLLAAGVLSLIGNGISMDPKTRSTLTTFLPVLPAVLTLWVLIRVLTQSMVNPGIGLFLTLIGAVACFIIGLTSMSKNPAAPLMNPQANLQNPNIAFQQPQPIINPNPQPFSQPQPQAKPQPQPYAQPAPQTQYQQQPYGQPQYVAPYPGQKQQQSKGTMAILCFFLGGWGIHRLMMGYSNWWLMIITLGGLGVWVLIDFIRILTGDMKMSDGRPLL